MESEPGRGSRVHLTAPFDSVDRAHSYHILAAEDNPINQRLAVLLLEKRGYRVTLAENGLEVLARLDQQRFDLILMDVQMPEMGGLEATRRIRERERISGEHIPIVAVTANAMKGDRERCLESGMDDYVSKPISPDEMFRVMEAQIAAGVKASVRC